MENRSVWLTTGLIFLIVLVFVFVLLEGAGPDFEEEILGNDMEQVEQDETEEANTDEEVTEENATASEEEEVEGEETVSQGSEEHTIQQGENLAIIAAQYDVTVDDLQYWNGLLNPSALNAGATLIVDGPNAAQAEKEEWQWEFEQQLYDTYGVTVSEYEVLEDGYYGVYVNEVETQGPYITVNSETGEFSS